MIPSQYLPIVALVAWGLWATVVKYGVLDLPPATTAIIIHIISLPMFIVFAISTDQTQLPTEWRSVGVVVIAGSFSAIGTLSYYKALSEGVDTSVATTVSALYFVVPVLLALLVLTETPTLREVVGAIFAVIAVVLLTG